MAVIREIYDGDHSQFRFEVELERALQVRWGFKRCMAQKIIEVYNISSCQPALGLVRGRAEARKPMIAHLYD